MQSSTSPAISTTLSSQLLWRQHTKMRGSHFCYIPQNAVTLWLLSSQTISFLTKSRTTPEQAWTIWRSENSWPYWDSNSDLSVIQPIVSCYTDCETVALGKYVIPQIIIPSPLLIICNVYANPILAQYRTQQLFICCCSFSPHSTDGKPQNKTLYSCYLYFNSS
jgi:hypothetical protein